MKLAIFSAFPQEIKHIVKNLEAAQILKGHPFPVFFGRYGSVEIIVVPAGMGGRNSENALECVLEKYGPDLVISVGFGGALYDGSVIGENVLGSEVFLINDRLEETLQLPLAEDFFSRLTADPTIRKGSILTIDRWRKKSEVKKILPPGLFFPVCDMETFFLAKLAIRKGLPFLAFRSITDREYEEIPHELLTVLDETGQYRFSHALGLLLKPRLIKDIARIGKNAGTASKNLWHAVKSIIEAM